MIDNNVSPTRNRVGLAGLAASATLLVSIALNEGYSDHAITPVPGDVPTIGFGTTQGVKPGDTITPPQALVRALRDVQKTESAIHKCVTVPLSRGEYDAGVSLAYNIGATAFCRSSVVSKWNRGDYTGGCEAILLYDKFKGKPLAGLTKRRIREYQQCIGVQNA